MAPSLRASITVFALYLVYVAYGLVVSPLTQPEVKEQASSSVARADVPPPSDTVVVARDYLPAATGAADAKFQLHLEKEGYVYFDEYRPIDDDRGTRVRITPFALVWFDPRREDHVPYTVTCTSAVIEFEERFDPGRRGSDENRIVGGEFSGEVRITGPDGLELEGRNIVLSEGSGERGSLYSPLPVRFAYGPAAGQKEQVRGQADGFEITLKSGEDSVLGQDMPRISGIEQLVLRFNVILDVLMEDGGELLPLSVRCEERFLYDFSKLLAQFDTNVVATRPTHGAGEPEEYDRLTCRSLTLQFEPKESVVHDLIGDGAEGAPPIRPVAGISASSAEKQRGLDLDLELHSARAIGPDVVMTSDEHDLHCRVSDLHYHVPSRTTHLLDDEKVEVRIGSSHFACPDVRFVHDEESRIRSAQCEGIGWAWQTNEETGETELETSWSERLVMSKDPGSTWDLLELYGDARVVQHQQEVGIVGDVLRVWFDGDLLQESSDPLLQSSGGRLPARELPLRRVVAEQTGNVPVTMLSPSIHLETRRVEAEFTEQTAAHPLASAPGGGLSFESRSDVRKEQEPIFVTAGAMRASIAVDPVTNKTDISELLATTDVRIIRNEAAGGARKSDDAADGPFSVECETLTLHHNADGQQVLQLQGAPAFIRLADAETEIEGNDILFDRTRNHAQVKGPGTIAVYVDRDFQGRALEAHERLRVRWKESMQFDGETATFLGETETTLSDSVMKCHQMDVTLNRRISFADEKQETSEVDVARIHCRDGVTVEYHEWAGPPTTIVGLRWLKVAEFSYDRSTGKFSALGPGTVDDWQRGNDRNRIPIAPQKVAADHQAAAGDEMQWHYTGLNFRGELTGNQHDQYMVLKDRVEAIHGPVKDALQKIDRDRGDLDADTETAKNSVWLLSDEMHLFLRSSEKPDVDDWLEVVAFGNAEMEGKLFRVRADAVSYDQLQGKFSLKGKGRNEAGIWFQKAPGVPWQNVQATTVYAIPSKNEYWSDGTTGLRFTPQ